MRFFISPFTFIFELIGFILSIAFVYGLAIIASFTIIAIGIADLKSKAEPEPIIRYEERVVTEYVPIVEKKEKSLVCEKFNGCEFRYENGKEVCPDCVLK